MFTVCLFSAKTQSKEIINQSHRRLFLSFELNNIIILIVVCNQDETRPFQFNSTRKTFTWKLRAASYLLATVSYHITIPTCIFHAMRNEWNSSTKRFRIISRRDLSEADINLYYKTDRETRL